MKKILEFLRRERMYMLLLIFIVTVNLLAVIHETPKAKSAKAAKEAKATTAKVEREKKFDQDMDLRRAETDKMLRSNPFLAVIFSLASLLIVALFLLGIFIDMILVSMRFKKKKLQIATYTYTAVRWGLIDVARVVILFLFFGYVLIVIESLLLRFLPLLKNDNIRMILNTSILDVLAVVLIIYFAVKERKADLVSLGISLKNFSKNVFYGAIGYLAAIPILLGTLSLIVVAVNITKYMPEKQPIVELFLKEKDVTLLMYSSIFAAVAGPIIEELFFRGFLYNALKKYIGIFWSMMLTAAVFAGLHSNLAGFLPILVLGIALTYIYEKTGTLVSSITLHVTHNLSMVFLVFLVKQLGIS